ncbi:MAG TPA: hypothetical protein VLV76_29140 [Candidatus Acidoferrum sp.]|nr:hypothetical protein [Candidatus Acidoferrum sp.]
MTRDLRARLGDAWVDAGRELERWAFRAHIAQPKLLGPAIRGPLVQLYRADADFTTEVGFVNYLTFYLLDADIGITVTVTAYDRDGRRLGRGRHRVGRKQALQRPLAELVDGPLDAHGLFTIEAAYDPKAIDIIAFLGQTAPQFMTLFVPTAGGAAAPQLLHSHKVLQRSAVPYSPCRWQSPVIERLAAVETYSVFVINACRSRLAGRVELAGVERADALWHANYSVPGRGVGRVDIRPPALGLPLDQPFRFACDFDRRTPHRKPILFRRFPDGSVTGNHS